MKLTHLFAQVEVQHGLHRVVGWWKRGEADTGFYDTGTLRKQFRLCQLAVIPRLAVVAPKTRACNLSLTSPRQRRYMLLFTSLAAGRRTVQNHALAFGSVGHFLQCIFEAIT